jgi:hypothetical protein
MYQNGAISACHVATIDACETSRRGVFQRISIEDALSFAIVLAVVLGPLRLGFSDTIRPTTVVLLPCAAYVLLTNLRVVGNFLKTRLGLGFIAFMILLIVGHVLDNDKMAALAGDDYHVLTVEALVGMPMVLLSGMALARENRGRLGIVAGLLVGLFVHVASIAIFPPAVTYRGYDRMAGLLQDPNILLLHIIPVFFLWQGFLKTRTAVILAQVCLPAIIWATLQTLSRAGLASLLAGWAVQFFAYLLFARTAGERFRGIGFFVMVALLALLLSRFDFVQERVDAYVIRNQERTGQAGSMIGDRMLWLHELEHQSISDHLLNPLGMGYSAFQKDNPVLPHNTFVDIYIIGGPFALLLYCGLFFSAFKPLISALARRASWDHLRFSRMGNAALCACFISEILLLSSLSVISWKVSWLILGLLLGYGSWLRKQTA